MVDIALCKTMQNAEKRAVLPPVNALAMRWAHLEITGC